MYVNREPRFYLTVMWNRQWYHQANREVQMMSNEQDGGPTHDAPQAGYLNRKKVSLEQNQRDGIHPYRPGILYRLGEAYLNYAEACVGYGKEGYPEKGMAYLDKVRERAGLKPVLESWANAKVPLTSYDGQCGPDGRVMKIVRQERMIELYQENHNFWDIRRWKMGETYFNVKARGLNILAETMEDFAKIVEIQDLSLIHI